MTLSARGACVESAVTKRTTNVSHKVVVSFLYYSNSKMDTGKAMEEEAETKDDPLESEECKKGTAVEEKVSTL